jgi:hypothetical protein
MVALTGRISGPYLTESTYDAPLTPHCINRAARLEANLTLSMGITYLFSPRKSPPTPIGHLGEGAHKVPTYDSTEKRFRSNGHAKPYDTRMIPRHYCPTKFWLYSADSLSATYLPHYRSRWRSNS